MPITFYQHQLANGLTILGEANPEAHTSAVGFFVNTGTRDEERALMGVSHFLEHMVFKGSARRCAQDVNREFDELGADYNAFTGHEATVFYAQVLPEFLPRATDLLADLLSPTLREEDFRTEKQVILEEIGMYEDKPAWRLQDLLLEEHYAGHPLAFRVLGTRESVEALTAAQMTDYFRGRYSPRNITVAAAGKLDFDAFAGEVERLSGGWLDRPAARTLGEPRPALVQRTFTDRKLNRHYLAAAIPAPPAQDDHRYAARILADVLGDVDGSRLYWSLIDPGLADDAAFGYEPQDGTGVYLAWASCDPKRAAQVEQVLLTTLDAYAAAIDPAEIQRVKNKIATAATLHGERPLGRMTSLGGTWLYYQRYIPLEQELARIMAVTADEVRDLLAAWPLDRRTVVRLGP